MTTRLLSADPTWLGTPPFSHSTVFTAGSVGEALQKRGICVTDAPYGAIGDGVTGAAAGINLALQKLKTLGGGICFIPEGTFLAETTILVPSNVTLCGAGPNATTIKAAAGLGAIIIRSEATSATFNSNITIRDLRIDGNQANQTAATEVTGIKMFSVANLLIENVVGEDIEGHGIHCNNSGLAVTGQRCTNVIIDTCGSAPNNTFGSCFAVTDGLDFIFTGCHAYRSAKAGFRISGDDYVFNGCVAKENGNGGIVPVSGDLRGLTVNGGIFADNIPGSDWPCDGLRLVGVDDATITGAVIWGNYDCGIAILNGCNNVLIDNCVVRNNGQGSAATGATQRRSGIAVFDDGTACTDIIITNCNVYDDQGTPTQDYGIEIGNSSADVLIDHCRFGAAQTSKLGQLQTTNTVRVGNGNIGLGFPSHDPGVDATVTGTTSTTAMSTTSLLANEFGRRGVAHFKAAGTYTGAAGTKTISIAAGGATLTFAASASGSTSTWRLDIDLYATSTTGVRIVATLFQDGVTEVIYNSAAITTTAAWSVVIRGKLSDGADSIVMRLVEASRSQ